MIPHKCKTGNTVNHVATHAPIGRSFSKMSVSKTNDAFAAMRRVQQRKGVVK